MSEELEALKDRAEKIYRSCQGWKSCKDGSYEMALDTRGYYEVLKEIERLKGQNERS